MTQYVGAIDQGTTSTRFIVFNKRGEILASHQKEHRQIYPRPGWVEHNATEIWHNTLAVIETTLQRAGLRPSDLVAVGITNQRETTVMWDRHTGKPLHNALVWQDTRVDDLVARYARDGGQDRFRAQTGLPLASYFSALKLQWLLAEVPGARAMAQSGDALFGTIDSWLLWNLTGGAAEAQHLTDVTNASRTQMMNLGTLAWDPELLSIFDIPRACLPAIVPSSAIYGEATVPILKGVHLAGILGDQQAALSVKRVLSPGRQRIPMAPGAFCS
jgi:glycerol kinase